MYDLGNGRVLRRYRDQRNPERVAAEAEVMTHARASGVPVPEVFDVSGHDIVMERVAGPTMLEAVGRRPWTAGAQARWTSPCSRASDRACAPAVHGRRPTASSMVGPATRSITMS